MKNAIAPVLTMVIYASLGFGQEIPEKVFRDLENQIARAVIAKDAAQLTKLYTSDYITVGGAGQIWSKAEIINAFTSGGRVVSAPKSRK